MPRHLSEWLCAVCLALIPSWALGMGACERIVATGVGGQPPYLWQDPEHPEQLIGASVDLLQLLASELGLAITIVPAGSVEQAEQDVISGRIDLLLNARLTVPLQERLEFISPPLHEAPSVVWVAHGHPFTYLDQNDLLGRQGIRLAEPFSSSFERFAQDELQLSTAADLSQAWSQLLQGRSEYLLYERYRGHADAVRRGLVGELEVLEPAVDTNGLYLAISPASVCNDTRLRDQLMKAITKVVEQEEMIERLLKENLRRWAGQQLPMNADTH